MKSKKEDRRIRYTKMILEQSLLELMKEKPINKITVTDVCKLADINRNTFYVHYSCPQDLLIQIENKFFDEIHSSIHSPLKTVADICQCIFVNSELCKILFSEYGDKDFLKRLINIPYDKMREEWNQMSIDMNCDVAQLELLYIFFANGGIGLIQHWIQSGMKESPQEIASLIEKLSTYGLNSFFNKM